MSKSDLLVSLKATGSQSKREERILIATESTVTPGFVEIGFTDGNDVYEVNIEDLRNAMEAFYNISKIDNG